MAASRRRRSSSWRSSKAAAVTDGPRPRTGGGGSASLSRGGGIEANQQTSPPSPSKPVRSSKKKKLKWNSRCSKTRWVTAPKPRPPPAVQPVATSIEAQPHHSTRLKSCKDEDKHKSTALHAHAKTLREELDEAEEEKAYWQDRAQVWQEKFEKAECQIQQKEDAATQVSQMQAANEQLHAALGAALIDVQQHLSRQSQAISALQANVEAKQREVTVALNKAQEWRATAVEREEQSRKLQQAVEELKVEVTVLHQATSHGKADKLTKKQRQQKQKEEAEEQSREEEEKMWAPIKEQNFTTHTPLTSRQMANRNLLKQSLALFRDSHRRVLSEPTYIRAQGQSKVPLHFVEDLIRSLHYCTTQHIFRALAEIRQIVHIELKLAVKEITKQAEANEKAYTSPSSSSSMGGAGPTEPATIAAVTMQHKAQQQVDRAKQVIAAITPRPRSNEIRCPPSETDEQLIERADFIEQLVKCKQTMENAKLAVRRAHASRTLRRSQEKYDCFVEAQQNLDKLMNAMDIAGLDHARIVCHDALDALHGAWQGTGVIKAQKVLQQILGIKRQ